MISAGKSQSSFINKTDLEIRLSRELLNEIGSRWKEKDPNREDTAGFSEVPIRRRFRQKIRREWKNWKKEFQRCS